MWCFQSHRPTNPTLENLAGVLNVSAVRDSKVVDIYPAIKYCAQTNKSFGDSYEQRAIQPFHIEKGKFYIIAGS